MKSKHKKILYRLITLTALFLEAYQSYAVLINPPPSAWSRAYGLSNSSAAIQDYWRGVPIGGIGSPTFDRTYSGDFSHWKFDIGRSTQEVVHADQFSVFMKQSGSTQSQVLHTWHPSSSTLSSWNWDYPQNSGTYYGLFPKAWVEYTKSSFPAELAVTQFTPVIPHNYKESSYPIGIFIWEAKNKSSTTSVEVSVMFSWRNYVPGTTGRSNTSNISFRTTRSSGDIVGVTLDSSDGLGEWDGGEFSIAAKEISGSTVTFRTGFDTSGDGSSLWNDFSSDGKLDDGSAGSGIDLGGAIAIHMTLGPNEQKSFPIVIAWDFPMIKFDRDLRTWWNYYTKWFDTDGENSREIAELALDNYQVWLSSVDAWMNPILNSSTYSEKLKRALFNELYYLTFGGSFWENGISSGSADITGISNKFGILEYSDYPFYEPLDVRYYSSFPIIALWPNLDEKVLRNYSYSALVDTYAPYAISHDLGACRKESSNTPIDSAWGDPLITSNAYWWHGPEASDLWKDLNTKFVLQVYRHFRMTGNFQLLKDMWDNCKKAMEIQRSHDHEGDDLPDNNGADHTFDNWPQRGTSVYSSGITIAAVQAMKEMAKLLHDTPTYRYYDLWLNKAKTEFDNQLWYSASGYFYIATEYPNYDTILADQINGDWYSRMLELGGFVSASTAASVIDTIYNHNVLTVSSGTRGVRIGMRPNDTLDPDSESQRIWTGVSYALAAYFYQSGKSTEAAKIIDGLVDTTYGDRGYWYNTPESWQTNGELPIAPTYLRPMAVWAVYQAVTTTPVVNILAPLEGTTVFSTVQIEASVTNTVATNTIVEVSIDGGSFLAMSTNGAGNYIYSWNTNSSTEGYRVIVVRAKRTDMNDLVSIDAASVLVDNTNDAPTVEIVSPVDKDQINKAVKTFIGKDDSIVRGQTWILAYVQDDRTYNPTVEVKIGTGTYQSMTLNSTGYYEYLWNSTNEEDDTWVRIEVRGTDGSNLSNGATAVVLVDNYRPQYWQSVACGSTGTAYGSARLWAAADQSYSSGPWGYSGGYVGHFPVHDNGSPRYYDSVGHFVDDGLAMKERWGPDFYYYFDVPNGDYKVTLGFDEFTFSSSSQRVFDVYVEDKLFLDDFDIFKETGHDYAILKTTYTKVTDRQIKLRFVSSVDYASVFYINVESSGSVELTASTAIASSGTEFPPYSAVDNSTNTRWSSESSDPQWIYVDLGQRRLVNKVVLSWETAYGKSYKIQVSSDANTWVDMFSTTNGDGGEDLITFSNSVPARYVRMYGTERGTQWGYSLWEFDVYGYSEFKTEKHAFHRVVDTSSFESSSYSGKYAVDASTNTRWSSSFSDPQWIQVDLGVPKRANQVILDWESAYGKAYKIQFTGDAYSDTVIDSVTWVTVYSTDNAPGGKETIYFDPVDARYVRMYGTQRGTSWGYSLWDFQVRYQPNNALKKSASASSGAEFPPSNAVDGNPNTRWSSDSSDPQWIYVDLGKIKPIQGVRLNWEVAYGKSYKIQISDDGANWTDVFSTTTGNGGIDNISFDQTLGRYVRMYGTERGTVWGYSLWEFEIY